MKIGVAQIRPATGDITGNIVAHQKLIELAVSSGAETVIFPELSITGYAPAFAIDLAVELDDHRFDIFQTISDRQQITIGIGAPTRHPNGICISLILFQPFTARWMYSKIHLHSSEKEIFVPGPLSTGLIGRNANAALAICYELSVPEHAASASQNGAEIYIASVADPVEGIERVLARLSQIAREHSMTVLMSNCTGRSGDRHWAGRSSVYSRQGVLLRQLDDASEGVIVVDTETHDVVQRTIDALNECTES